MTGCRYCRPSNDGLRAPVVANDRCASCLPNAPAALDATGRPLDVTPPAPVLSVPALPGRCAHPKKINGRWIPCDGPITAGYPDRCQYHTPAADRRRETVRGQEAIDALESRPDAIGVGVT